MISSFLIVIFILIVGVLIYIPESISSSILIYSLNIILKLVLSDNLKHFNVKFIRIFPTFILNEWEISLKATRDLPELLISWKKLIITIEIKKLLYHITFSWMNDSHYQLCNDNSSGVIQIDLIDFHIQMIGLRFKDVLNPSNKSKNNNLSNHIIELIDLKTDNNHKYLFMSRLQLYLQNHLNLLSHFIQQLSLLFHITFVNISFDFQLTSHSAESQGSATTIDIYFCPLNESNSINGIVLSMKIDKGEVDVHQNNQKAFAYCGDIANLRVDYHIPSGMQKVKLILNGSNNLDVAMEPFLFFYHKYQTAEDDAIEVKMSRLLDTSGKMYEIVVHFASMKVSVRDKRLPTVCVMNIIDVTASINNYKLTKSNKWFLKGLNRYVPIDSTSTLVDNEKIDQLSANNLKIMKVSVHEVNWPYHNKGKTIAYVINTQLYKEMKVVNEDRYEDTDLMNISVDIVNFQRVSKVLFEWLVVLQDLSNLLPSSRFAHYKHQTMSMTVHSVTYSMNPYLSGGSINLYTDDNNNETAVHSEFFDEIVIIHSTNNHILKYARTNDPLSPMEVSIGSMNVHGSYLTNQLEYLYNMNIDTTTDNPTDRMGVVFSFHGMKVNLLSGQKVIFKNLSLENGLSIYVNHVLPTIIPIDDLNTFNNSISQSYLFTQMNQFKVIWHDVNPSFYLGDVQVNMSIGIMLKFLSIFNMIKDFNSIIQSTVNKYKTINPMKANLNSSNPSIDPINTINMDNMTIDFFLSKNTIDKEIYNEIYSIDMNFTNVKFILSNLYNEYNFSNFDLKLNKYDSKSLFKLGNFHYSIQKPLKNDSTPINKPSRNDKSLKSGTQKEKETWRNCDNLQMERVEIDEVYIGMSCMNHMSHGIEAIFQQYDGYKTCMNHYNNLLSKAKDEINERSDDFTIDNPIYDSPNPLNEYKNNEVNSALAEHNNLSNFRPNAYVLTSEVKNVIISFDCFYRSEYKSNLFTVCYSNINLSIDGSQKESELYSNIASLDYIGEISENILEKRFVMYSNVIGGYINSSISKINMSFDGIETPYIVMSDVVIQGDMYMSSVDDKRILKNSVDIQLDDVLSIETVKSSAPSLIYCKLNWNFDNICVSQDEDTSDYFNTILAAMPMYTPVNRDTSPPLPLWDNLSFWFHGTTHINIQTFEFKSSMKGNLMETKICFACDDMILSIEPGAIECSMKKIQVDATVSNNIASPNKRRIQFVDDNVYRLIDIPGFLITSHSKRYIDEKNLKSYYNHHDVYINPSNNEDKYLYYRVKPNSLQVEIEILFCDTPSEPITLNGRLDILIRVLDSINQSSKEKSMNLQSEHKASPDVSTIIRKLDIQVGINSLLICSWMSSTKLAGFVYYHQQMDVQLRLIRPSSNDEASLEVDHLYIEIGYAELYVREWDLFDVNATLSMKNGSLDASRRSGRYKPFESPDATKNPSVDRLSIYSLDPKYFDKVKRLFLPNYKLIHLSKIEVSLTEERDALGTGICRSTTFGNHGVMNQFHKSVQAKRMSERNSNGNGLNFDSNKKSGKEIKQEEGFISKCSFGTISFIVGREKRWRYIGDIEPDNTIGSKYLNWRINSQSTNNLKNKILSFSNPMNRNRRSSIRSNRTNSSDLFSHDMPNGTRYKYEPLIDGYRPSILSFALNHTTLSPPFTSLPASYQTNRFNNIYRRSSTKDSSNINIKNKIWGLRMIDSRLLWTIDIRDILFTYVSRYFELFLRPNEEESENDVSIHQNSSTNSGTQTPYETNAQEIKLDKVNEKLKSTPNKLKNKPKNETQMNLKDFLNLENANDSIDPNQNISPIQNLHIGTTRNRLNSAGNSDKSPISSLIPVRKSLFIDNSSDLSVNNTVSPALSPLVSPVASEKNEKNEIEKVKKLRDLLKHSSHNNGSTTITGRSKRGSLFNKSLNISKNHSINSNLTAINESSNNKPIFSSTPSATSAISSALPSGVSSIMPSAIPTTIHSLEGSPYRGINNNSPERNNQDINNARRNHQGMNSPSKNYQAMNSPGQNSNSTKSIENKGISKSLSSKFFIIELIDPQINFLDVESHGSLIIVAGRSYLEGSRMNVGYINENNKSNSPPQRMSEIRLLMDGVSAFTVPTTHVTQSIDPNNNIQQQASDVIHWKQMNSTIYSNPLSSNTNNNLGIPSISESPYLKVAIKDFKIRAMYTFWSNVLITDDIEILIRNEEFVCSFLLDLPEIIIDTDSSQFYIIINILRNLLLVPPPPLPRYIQLDKENKDSAQSLKWIHIHRDPEILLKHNIKSSSLPLDIKNKASKDEIKILVEESMDRVFDVDLGMARLVEIFIGRGTWILRTNHNHNAQSNNSSTNSAQSTNNAPPTNADLVETGFTGVYATFTFHEDRSASVLFEVQRFWARNVNNNDINWIMMPILDRIEECVRCKCNFTTETNDCNSCIFHADENGLPGEYKEIQMIDELTKKPINVSMWSCCGNIHKDAPGCSARPHVCREVMISIRAETNPSVKIEKIHLSVLNTLEISFFPGASYDLQVQITKRLVDILHHFFSLEAAASDYQELINEIDKDKSLDELNESSDKSIDNQNKPIKQSSLNRLTSLLHSSNKTAEKVTGNKERRLTITSPTIKPPRNIPQITTSETIKDDNKTIDTKQEGIYIRYMRVGDIYVYVSTAGFLLNIDKSRAVVEPFFCRGEILDWHGLIVKLERHATWSVTKNIASDSLNRIGTFVKNRFSIITKNKKSDDSDQLIQKRALLLGLANDKKRDSFRNHKHNSL